MLRVMIVDDSEERSLYLRLMLEQVGYTVVAEVFEPRRIYDAVRDRAPDVIIIDTESPSRDTLEHIALLSETAPRPIVMFSSDRASDTIREAVQAGVSAYIVDGLAAERVQPIIEVAIARFESYQAVKTELAQVKTKLSERKVVEKAKGVLMKARSIGEDEAYSALRKMAMERSLTIGEVSRQLLAVSDLLG
jgi:two-component system, response regulator / RNA-binding antiterminator